MKTKNQSPIKALFNNVKSLTTEDITKSKEFKLLLKSEVPKRIEKAFKEKKDVATIFEINASSSFVEIKKSDWINALDQCIKWYGEEEDFNKCIELKELVTKIKEQTK